MTRRGVLWLASMALAVVICANPVLNPASAEKKYDPGASDTEIKVGNIMP